MINSERLPGECSDNFLDKDFYTLMSRCQKNAAVKIELQAGVCSWLNDQEYDYNDPEKESKVIDINYVMLHL